MASLPRQKQFPSLGACGIDCGLCPRHYADGKSRCPGCGGEDFESKHPACSFKTCCVDEHGLEICAQCEDFPCAKYADRKKIKCDSFVTHKRIFINHEAVRILGLDDFLAEQNRRVAILHEMLAHYNNGRSKNFYCLAAALLSTQALDAALDSVPALGDLQQSARELKVELESYAAAEGVTLALQKD